MSSASPSDGSESGIRVGAADHGGGKALIDLSELETAALLLADWPQAEIDRFCDAVLALATAAKAGDAERFKGAPFHAPLRRLDETQAARKPKLRWRPEEAPRVAAE